MQNKKTATLQIVKLALTFIVTVLPFVVFPFVLVSGRLEARSNSLPATAIMTAPNTGADHPLLPPKGEILPSKTRIGYDVSVLNAVKKMEIVLNHFDTWIDEHPESTLSHVRYMPVTMQQNVASTALFIRTSNSKIDAKTAWREAAALVHYSAKYGVPSVLTTAVAHVESTFNPDAVSSKGASGVMQVMWRIHNGLLQSNGIQATPGPNPLADPEKAIAAGCLLLSRYIKAYGSVQTAMDRYYGARSSSYHRKVNNNIARIMTHRTEIN